MVFFGFFDLSLKSLALISLSIEVENSFSISCNNLAFLDRMLFKNSANSLSTSVGRPLVLNSLISISNFSGTKSPARSVVGAPLRFLRILALTVKKVAIIISETPTTLGKLERKIFLLLEGLNSLKDFLVNSIFALAAFTASIASFVDLTKSWCDLYRSIFELKPSVAFRASFAYLDFSVYGKMNNFFIKKKSENFEKNTKDKIKEMYITDYIYTLEEILEYVKNTYNELKKDLFHEFFVFKGLDELIPTTENDFNKTLNAIKNGIPILLQVPLMNEQLRLRGVADIVIRSDWINRIYKREVIPKNEQKTPSGRYYYVVIDIKYTSMTLCANGYTIRNDGRFKGYKGQLLIYNIALGLIQNYIPYYIFLMSFYLIMMVEHLQ